MRPSITVYTNAFCPVCHMVKDFLDALDVSYKEVQINIKPLIRIQLILKTRKLTVPQTKINEKWITGFDPEAIMQALDDSPMKK